MFRIADLFDINNEFICKVKYSINENDQKLLTVLLENEDELIVFDPKEKVILISYSLDYTFFYTIRFSNLNSLLGKKYYSFEVSSFNVSLNHRNEYRQPTDMDGLVHTKSKINPVKILDKSKNGLKITSEYPISGNSVMVSYKNNFDIPVNLNSTIKWKTYEDGLYVYGLQTV